MSSPAKRLAAGLSALIFLLNLAICREIFHTEYTLHMGSIEGAYIGISRYLLTHRWGSGWFPWWYGGIPLQNTYPPLLHILVAIVAGVLHISTALSHHAVTGFFYCLGPVAVFLLGCSLSKDWKPSLGAALLFSLTSPSALLMHSVRGDLGSVQLPRRFQTLVVYGEGPHVTSITLLILAILALHAAAQRRSWASIAVAAVALAAVVSTNWLGAFALTMAVLCYLLALPRALPVALLSGLLGYGLAVPWIPPSTIMAVQRNAQFTVGAYPLGRTQAVYGLLLLTALAGLRWVLARYGASLPVTFSSCFLLLMAGITLPAEWFHIYLVPQPERYHLEMEFAVVLVVAFGMSPLFRRVNGKWLIALLVVLVALGVFEFRKYRFYARNALHPVEIQQTIEYEAGYWLQQNLPGRRVFADGSVRFWLNAFADNPQVGGGFDQGIVNPEIPVMTFGIPYMSGDGPVSAMWLRILGASAVSVTEQTGRDAYKDWRDPQKFRGVLPELWRNGGDVIYDVPRRTDSLVHAIPKSAAIQNAPYNVTDVAQAQKLDAALADPALPAVPVQQVSDSEMHVSGILRPDLALFVQVSYHPGWHAVVNAVSKPIRRDGMGFMIIEPECDGTCEVKLFYDGGSEMIVAKYIRIATIIFMLICLCCSAWRRLLPKTRPAVSNASPIKPMLALIV